MPESTIIHTGLVTVKAGEDIGTHRMVKAGSDGKVYDAGSFVDFMQKKLSDAPYGWINLPGGHTVRRGFIFPEQDAPIGRAESSGKKGQYIMVNLFNRD